MKKVVWFDMNNVICDFYGQNDMNDVYRRLDSGDCTPYLEANIIDEGVQMFNRFLNDNEHWEVGIITRLSKKVRSEKIDMETYINKYNWLCHNVTRKFKYFWIIPYMGNKFDWRRNDDDWVVDDDKRVWKEWGNGNIIKVLKK